MSDYTPPETYDIPGLGIIDRDEAVAIRQAIGQQDADHRAKWEARQKEAGKVWTAVYWRYQQQYEEEEFSLQEAQEFLVYGEEAGEMSAVGVRCPDGSMLKYSYDWCREQAVS